MANVIVKEILHPDNDDNVDIYPKTSYDQIVNPPNLSIYQEKNSLEQDIKDLGFEKVEGNPIIVGTNVLERIKIGDKNYILRTYIKLYKHEFTLTTSTATYNVRLISTRDIPYGTIEDFRNDLIKMCLNIFLRDNSSQKNYEGISGYPEGIVMWLLEIPSGSITQKTLMGNNISVSDDTLTEI